MTSIGDLSEAPRHQIKVVCAQTGIRPVTLRAWERRYRVLKPKRTRGNYRLYSEQDVAVLRWLKERVESGVTVSRAVTELHTLWRRNTWPEAIPAVPPVRVEMMQNPPPELAQELFQTLMAHDQVAAGRILSQAQADYDLAAVCTEVVTPCLGEIGEAWYGGRIKVASEHFASTVVHGWLLALFQGYPLRPGAARILVGCAPGEFHDIGALMFALLLRREGYRVEFLGQDLPLEDLLAYVRTEHPALVCLSAASPRTARELQLVEPNLERIRPRTRFGFAGRAFNQVPELRATVSGAFLGPTITEAEATVRQLLAS